MKKQVSNLQRVITKLSNSYNSLNPSSQHGRSATELRWKDLAMDPNRIVVFSGGSAANNLVDIFGKVAHGKDCSLS
jgi:hypothetical protein